jgi:nucleotide-binding universal stress UspA family protein
VRSAVAPVLVVPPDLDVRELGQGPVVALTSLSADSVDACRFAASMAERLGRGLALLHVVALPEDYGAPYLPLVSLEDLRRELRERAEKDLTSWIAANGLRPDVRSVMEGRVLEGALAFAAQQRSPLLVCGARRASLLERTLIASTGSELAAMAPLPVAIVPPHA